MLSRQIQKKVNDFSADIIWKIFMGHTFFYSHKNTTSANGLIVCHLIKSTHNKDPSEAIKICEKFCYEMNSKGFLPSPIAK